jgi:hypothetical protein
MYAGVVRALEPVARDPAGIITGRDLFTATECARRLDEHDQILLKQAVSILRRSPGMARRVVTFV